MRPEVSEKLNSMIEDSDCTAFLDSGEITKALEKAISRQYFELEDLPDIVRELRLCDVPLKDIFGEPKIELTLRVNFDADDQHGVAGHAVYCFDPMPCNKETYILLAYMFGYESIYTSKLFVLDLPSNGVTSGRFKIFEDGNLLDQFLVDKQKFSVVLAGGTNLDPVYELDGKVSKAKILVLDTLNSAIKEFYEDYIDKNICR